MKNIFFNLIFSSAQNCVSQKAARRKVGKCNVSQKCMHAKTIFKCVNRKKHHKYQLSLAPTHIMPFLLLCTLRKLICWSVEKIWLFSRLRFSMWIVCESCCKLVCEVRREKGQFKIQWIDKYLVSLNWGEFVRLFELF